MGLKFKSIKVTYDIGHSKNQTYNGIEIQLLVSSPSLAIA